MPLSEEQKKEIEEGIQAKKDFLATLPEGDPIIPSIQAGITNDEALLTPEPTEKPCPTCTPITQCGTCNKPIGINGRPPSGVVNTVLVGGEDDN